MPASEQMKSIFRRARSVRVDARRDATIRVVDACGYPVAAIGFYGRAAAAESCEEDDGAKRE